MEKYEKHVPIILNLVIVLRKIPQNEFNLFLFFLCLYDVLIVFAFINFQLR